MGDLVDAYVTFKNASVVSGAYDVMNAFPEDNVTCGIVGCYMREHA